MVSVHDIDSQSLQQRSHTHAAHTDRERARHDGAEGDQHKMIVATHL